MRISDLHPEDLLDRDADGILTPLQQALLDAHLAQCSACRFERTTRRDFAAALAAPPSP